MRTLNLNNHKYGLIIAASLFALLGCGVQRGTGGSGGGGGGSGGGGSSTSPSSAGFLYQVNVSTKYDTDTLTYTQGSCTVPTSAVPITPGPGPSPTNCTISIPQIQLYYSKLIFQIVVPAGACSLVVFRPYGYQISNSATYTIPGSTTAVDCSGATVPIPTACYGGAVIELAPGFPANFGTYFLTYNNSVTQTYSVTSAEEKRQNGGQFFGLTNRWTVNNLTDRVTTTADYLGNSMQDWRVICTDNTNYQYVMNLTITDIAGNGSSLYNAWNP